ncbi:hypothetical protein LTR36_001433 [Oleoguttula mirabilis]|uniref:Uncharacterized protein n=1 Tax=Oleoguttula mirabilis TaxID=1507867 RepID=A0AAV9JPI6_9PEZI|nr:hypothetical protein LTR36_001433 [Oleoguttula mirabilis]
MANVQPPTTLRAIRCGSRTFYFNRVNPYPNATNRDFTLGFMVQAALVINHDDTLSHHGDCIMSAAYAMFDPADVDAMIVAKDAAAQGAMNGSGGMSGAVVLVLRAVLNFASKLNIARAGQELNAVAEHIFDPSERGRAMKEVLASL